MRSKTPTIKIGALTKVKSKKFSPARPASRAKPSTIRLVEVPTKVSVPPNIVAYESGISKRLGACFLLRRMGPINVETTAVLLVTEEAKPAPNISFNSTLRSLPFSSQSHNLDIKRVFSKEKEAINSRKRLMRDSFTKLSSNCAVVSSPLK